MKNFTKNLLKRIVLLSFLLFTGTVYATNYYVDQKHAEASDANSGTIDKPWKTIDKANETLVAGDTVFIKAGIYDTYIEPANSGTDTARITYINYGKDKVTITETEYAIYLHKKAYITIEGINFFNIDVFLIIRNSNNIVINNCNFDKARLKDDGTTVSGIGSRIFDGSTHNRISNCQFSDYGSLSGKTMSGDVLTIGNQNSPDDMTSHNLVENCVLFHGGRGVLRIFGSYNVIRNNYVRNDPWLMGSAQCDQGEILYGNTVMPIGGFGKNSNRNLIEGNRVAYASDPPNTVGAGATGLLSSYNILRRNMYYHNDRFGVLMSMSSNNDGDCIHNKIYHNTFFHNALNTIDAVDHKQCAVGFGEYSESQYILAHNCVVNNLFYKHKEASENNNAIGNYKADLDLQYFAGNWDGDKQGDPKFVSADTDLGDPKDMDVPDFNLERNSPCRDQGTFLTTITSPAGTSTKFTVKDAGYFMDGWGIKGVKGDVIQLLNSTQTARIIEIDYETNEITVDKELTWTDNQGVCLPYEGKSPDPGAFECLGFPVSVRETSGLNEISVYPNPTTGLVTISLKEHGNSYLTVEIFNVTGSLLNSENINKPGETINIDLAKYPQGIYFLKISSSKVLIYNGTIIKK